MAAVTAGFLAVFPIRRPDPRTARSNAGRSCSFNPVNPSTLWTFTSLKSLNRRGSPACSPVAKIGVIHSAPTACAAFLGELTAPVMSGRGAVVVGRDEQGFVGEPFPQGPGDRLQVAGVKGADHGRAPFGRRGEGVGGGVTLGDDDDRAPVQLGHAADDVEAAFLA